MKIKVYNENGIVRVTKENENGYERTMFSSVNNGQVAVVEIQAYTSTAGRLGSISHDGNQQ